MMGNMFFDDFKPMSNEDMWKELDGQSVKCILSDSGEGVKIFVVQTLDTKKVYVLGTTYDESLKRGDI